MRNDFDFAPYYRATVGFDRVFDLLDSGEPSHRWRLPALQYREGGR